MMKLAISASGAICFVTISLFTPMAHAAMMISDYRPITGPNNSDVETYDAWMNRVIPLAIPHPFNAVGPINPGGSAVTTNPITAPPYQISAAPQYDNTFNPAPVPIGAPTLTFTRGPGVTHLAVSNLSGTSCCTVQFVSDLSVGNDENWSDIDIASSNPLTSFGFGVFSQHNSNIQSSGDSLFTITLFDQNGTVNVGSGTFVAPSYTPIPGYIGVNEDAPALPGLVFVGITSDVFFDSLQIRESRTYPTGGIQRSTSSGATVDAEYFGAFFATPVTASLPTAPGPLPILGLGAAFAYSRKLRQRIKYSKAPEVLSTIR